MIFKSNKNNIAAQIAPAIRMLIANTQTVCYLETKESIAVLSEKLDKIDLSSAGALYNDDIEAVYSAIELMSKEIDVVIVEKIGCFFIGDDKHIADAKKQAFIEQKTYQKTQSPARPELRLYKKIAIVTGSAQGFGDGIAREMIQQGAYVVIADLNEKQAQSNADELNNLYGKGSAIAVAVDVGDEDSVKHMMNTCVCEYGGLDIFVSNAGVLKAGGVDELTVKDFEFVTKVNYTAFFINVKYASSIMKIEHRFDPNYTSDIIQINSKSGLEGSNRNFAYAGSKFGGIGLVQSFAKELVDDNIKVNAICPGNFLDGPLWMDPERGLYRQYLDAGKVPGAKTIADVKTAYENKVPMRRGCVPKDVAKAIYYCVDQQYETGQAIPVTGGQNMLK